MLLSLTSLNCLKRCLHVCFWLYLLGLEIDLINAQISTSQGFYWNFLKHRRPKELWDPPFSSPPPLPTPQGSFSGSCAILDYFTFFLLEKFCNKGQYVILKRFWISGLILDCKYFVLSTQLHRKKILVNYLIKGQYFFVAVVNKLLHFWAGMHGWRSW